MIVRSWDELVRPRHGLKCTHSLMAMLAESDFSNTTIRRFVIKATDESGTLKLVDGDLD